MRTVITIRPISPFFAHFSAVVKVLASKCASNEDLPETIYTPVLAIFRTHDQRICGTNFSSCKAFDDDDENNGVKYGSEKPVS